MFSNAFLYYSIGLMFAFPISGLIYLSMLAVAASRKEYKKNKGIFYIILIGFLFVPSILFISAFFDDYYGNSIADYVIPKKTFFAYLILIGISPLIAGFWVYLNSKNKKIKTDMNNREN